MIENRRHFLVIVFISSARWSPFCLSRNFERMVDPLSSLEIAAAIEGSLVGAPLSFQTGKSTTI